MSTSSRSDTSSSSSSLDYEELLNIGARCRELRKEKDLLKASQSQSYNLIKSLNEAHSEDKRHIQKLETNLKSCCGKIDSLQDKVISLTEELNQSKLEVLYMKEEVDRKTFELKNSTLYIEKLEETISSAALESQCEIESLRLEMLSLEQSTLESKRSEEEHAQEEAVMRELIDQLKVQNEDARKIIESLEQENNKLRCMFEASQTQVKLFAKRVEEHLEVPLENVKSVQVNPNPTNMQVNMCGEVLGPLLLKLLSTGIFNPDAMEVVKMSSQIHEYELLVKRLKEEVKEEKFKAKEETEDLAQEMAELRYQLTELLEEERKRRACIEQASLQRISELEKQLQIARKKAVPSIRQTD